MSTQPSPAILVFDVNETLLDIDTLTPLFTRLFDDASILREWFAQLVLYSQTLTLSGIYTPFGELGVAALKMTANIHGISLSNADIDELKQRMSTMPAHKDVLPALTKLREAGFRLVTLTNSPCGDSPTPLEKAGISHFFEQHFSVEKVAQFKPASSTYHMVADALDVETSELCMVACHLWDTIGAQATGCQGAFITRPYNALLTAENIPMPNFIAQDLGTLADKIIAENKAA